MKKHGKKYRAAAEKIEEGRKYNLEEGIAKVKEISFAKFDETVELTMWLGVDPRKADQLVRGTLVLPHGLGKSKTVLVIAQGEKLKEAEEAGADIVGGEDILNKIKGGWTDFDAVIATPDMMRLVGALGKVLGPRGLMPNPKTGTVTFDVTTAVRETKAGLGAPLVAKRIADQAHELAPTPHFFFNVTAVARFTGSRCRLR